MLVTGTDNPLGIGAAIGSLFGEMGARPFLHRYQAADESPGDARGIAADLADASIISQLFDAAEQASGPVDS